jgi:NTP pyrophosphatase (non-canonical NTP hydrolase)
MIKSHQEYAKQFLKVIGKVPPEWAQALNVVGEAGEFAECYRRYSGYARRTDTLENVSLELADVIISAFCMAEMLNIDLDLAVLKKWDIIFSRGYGNQA